MKKQVWKSGPPPSIGWWPASAFNDKNSLRWWNGKCWSHNAYPECSALKAAQFAGMPTAWPTLQIKWTDRPKNWPERSCT